MAPLSSLCRFFRPCGALRSFGTSSHSLRCGLHSFAASRLLRELAFGGSTRVALLSRLRAATKPNRSKRPRPFPRGKTCPVTGVTWTGRGAPVFDSVLRTFMRVPLAGIFRATAQAWWAAQTGRDLCSWKRGRGLGNLPAACSIGFLLDYIFELPSSVRSSFLGLLIFLWFRSSGLSRRSDCFSL